MQRAIDLISESRIQEAMAEGQFDRLPGFGKPICGESMVFDETRWTAEKIREIGEQPTVQKVKQTSPEVTDLNPRSPIEPNQ
ncbi:MAG: DUF1992 domain-containing protein [Pirellulaceae bacterium]